MKRLSVIVGLFLSLAANAGMTAKIPVEDYNQKAGFDYMYDIKTSTYQNIILDCQGFIMGMSFFYNNELERKIYMDEEICQEVNQFLQESKNKKEPVCLELNPDDNSILFSRKTTDCL